MNIPRSTALNKTKVGTCPHGLPQGACPICNGMGGGGGGGSVRNKPEKEMSWSECYIVWQQILKAKNNVKQSQNEAIQARMVSQFRLQMSLNNAVNKLAVLISKLSNASVQNKSNPTFASKIASFSAAVALPILNAVKNVLSTVDKVINSVKQKIADISDKLNAIYGEIKNFVEKNISEKLKNIKRKIKSLFGFITNEDENLIDEKEKQVEESSKLFDVKTIFESIKSKVTPKFIKELKHGISG